jgi:hypothetical protein
VRDTHPDEISGTGAARRGAIVTLPRPASRWAKSDAPILAALLSCAAVLAWLAVVRRPDLYLSEDALFADTGVNLIVARRLLDGGVLYRDIAYQYGPASPYLHAALAAVLGNSLRTYILYHAVTSMVALALAYRLLRRAVAPAAAGTVALLGMLPTLVSPGAIVGAFVSAAYIPLERVAILLVVLAWLPPSERDWRTSARLGMLLGALQLVRFGTAVFVGLAVVLLDLALMAFDRRYRVSTGRWVRSLLVIGGAFAGVQLLITMVSYILLPADLATDFLWPLYTLEAYAPFSGARWPIAHWKYLVAHYTTPVVGIAASVVAFALLVRRGRSAAVRPGGVAEPAEWRLLLPPAVFLVAAIGFFRTVYHFEQFAWALMMPAALLVDRHGRRAMLVFAFLAMPGMLFMTRTLLLPPFAREARLVLPNAERLQVQGHIPAQVSGVLAGVRAADSSARMSGVSRPLTVYVTPTGAGFHALYDIPFHARQPWHIGGFVRPRDEREILSNVDAGTAAFIVLHNQLYVPTTADSAAPLSRDPCGWYVHPPYSRALCDQLAPRLAAPIRLEGGGWLVLPVDSLRPPLRTDAEAQPTTPLPGSLPPR